MRTVQLLSLLSFSLALPSVAHAQFSVSGPGSAIPASGLGGGVWDTGMPVAPASSTVAVTEAATMITSVVIQGLQHPWGGDIHATLTDPSGVEHNLFLRPGFMNPVSANFGTPGDFLVGNYTINTLVGSASFPTVADGMNISPGAYKQTFNTGGVTWTNGMNGIFNTPLGSIAAPAGTWELRIYDWGVGDDGSFTGWTLNGNTGGAGPNTGAPGCDCSGGNPSCSNSSPVASGCPNTAGTGAVLTGAGNAVVANDSFSLSVSGGSPGNFGLLLSGTASIGPVYTVANSAGGLCSGGTTNRSDVYQLDGTGAINMPTFKASVGGGAYGAAAGVGFQTYQYWYRDPGGALGCTTDGAGADFNFTNGWNVTWM